MADMAKKRSRLTIDLSPELRQRIKDAAVQQELSVSEYVKSILEAAVPLEQVPRSADKGVVTAEMIERIDEVRKTIMHGRRFEDDSTDIINEARAERTAEL